MTVSLSSESQSAHPAFDFSNYALIGGFWPFQGTESEGGSTEIRGHFRVGETTPVGQLKPTAKIQGHSWMTRLDVVGIINKAYRLAATFAATALLGNSLESKLLSQRFIGFLEC